jgi:hypothetical protein
MFIPVLLSKFHDLLTTRHRLIHKFSVTHDNYLTILYSSIIKVTRISIGLAKDGIVRAWEIHPLPTTARTSMARSRLPR